MSRRLRFRTLLGALVTVVLLASACGSGSSKGSDSASPTLPVCPLEALASASGPVEVVLWHFLAGKTGDTLNALVDKYNASQSKVHVRVESQGTDNEELFKKYQAGIKTKDLPGIAVMDDTVTQQMIDSGTVLPAQSCIQADHYDMSDFLKTGMDYYTVNGVLYPATLNLSGALLYYNKGHFRRAGLDPEKTPQTLDEVRQYAQKIKDAGVVDKPVALKVNSPLIEMWLTGAGAPIVDNDNGRGSGTTDQAAFDNATTVELYHWIDAMKHDGLLDVIADTPGQINQYLAMAQQNASMTIETSTAATTVEAFLGGTLDPNSVPGGATAPPVDPNALDLGAAPVPGIDAAGRLQMGGGAWYITNTTPPEVQAAAWDFIKYWNSLDTQVEWNLQGSYLPYRTSAAKDPRVVADWTTTQSGRWLAIAYDELINGVDPNNPGPLMGPYEQFRTYIRTSIENMIFNGASPESVVTKAASDTTAALQQYNQESF